MFKLLISSRARREIKKISKSHKYAILEALADIKEDPLSGKPLARGLTGRFSYRVGIYRIIYKIRINDSVVEILSAGHRAGAYN